jgi:hypothetical protein
MDINGIIMVYQWIHPHQTWRAGRSPIRFFKLATSIDNGFPRLAMFDFRRVTVRAPKNAVQHSREATYMASDEQETMFRNRGFLE